MGFLSIHSLHHNESQWVDVERIFWEKVWIQEGMTWLRRVCICILKVECLIWGCRRVLSYSSLDVCSNSREISRLGGRVPSLPWGNNQREDESGLICVAATWRWKDILGEQEDISLGSLRSVLVCRVISQLNFIGHQWRSRTQRHLMSHLNAHLIYYRYHHRHHHSRPLLPHDDEAHFSSKIRDQMNSQLLK